MGVRAEGGGGSEAGRWTETWKTKPIPLEARVHAINLLWRFHEQNHDWDCRWRCTSREGV